ncbi:MAG TPA: MG2 domain-containing protein [Cyclobacteriaceae bacterium]|nr:MG2 domain-containing protein [Cyclobacteriaceae bacterium]
MNPLWKKFLFSAAGLAVVIAGIYYFSHNKPDAIKPVDPAFAQYVSSYTEGLVGSGSTIRIVLANDAVEAGAVGESQVKLFSFSPSLSGKTVWIDRRTVEFQPDKRMTSGVTYTVSFELSKLIQVPDALRLFEFNFMVIPQNFELTIQNVRPYNPNELKRQKIEGLFATADFAEGEAIEKAVTAKQDGKPLKISWEHTGGGVGHNFIVEDVVRADQAGKVLIEVQGASLQMNRNETREVEIPALGDFKVMNVRVEQEANQFVVIQFSDPLNERQNLSGLISISDIPSLDIEIRGNEIRLYPPVRQVGTKTLTLEAGIKNVLDYRMASPSSMDVTFEQIAPAVRFLGKGSILPTTDGLILPFEAVSLKAVDIQILRVFEKNVIQFLQVNNLDGNEQLRRVGRPLIRKMVSLENVGLVVTGKWNRYTLDLSQYITPEPGAIYQVRIGFKRSYSSYACPDSNIIEQEVNEPDYSQPDEEESAWDSYEEPYYYSSDYDWEQKDNPCHSSYYGRSRSITRNIIASDLGLTAKRGEDGNVNVFVNDLRTTELLNGVSLEVYDYQQQLVGSGTTSDGKAVITCNGKPFVLIAKNGQQRGYLKLNEGEALSLSNFDVGGEQINEGIKGMIYGERGVWRPGDSLFLTFLLEDKLKRLPEHHPVVLELLDPAGQVNQRLVQATHENGFYKFAAITSPDAPTGNWSARVKVGGTQFSQNIRIETIKPNRLKINLDFGKDKIVASSSGVSGKLHVNWLTGAPGRNLKAEFEVLLTKAATKFDKYPGFIFDDPARDYSTEAMTLFSGTTDENGDAQVSGNIEVNGQPAGMLNAVFRGKVFEEGGDFSIDRFSLPFYPYASYTGIRLPEGDKARGMLLTDTTHRVDIVTVDAEGRGVSRDNIQVSISKLNWRWWWDTSDNGANYTTGSDARVIANGNVRTVDGKGTWTFRIKYPEWGRYIVRAVDPVSGHSTAKVIYVDWPGWAGRARKEATGATMLSFSGDKTTYAVGEKANIVIPGSNAGRALITIENGSRMLESYWLETKAGDNKFSFDIKPEMAPNVYVGVSLLQAHSQTVNDLPIRQYGVIPLTVEDPKTHLEPTIAMPDVLEPGQEVVIKVAEKSGRKMSYTLAMVDEGLLDITRFPTPDAWPRFYAREALGVRTWDIYDEVMGAFGGRVERLLAIGGDMLVSKEDESKRNRFKPVVKYLGPFTTDGSGREHRFIMPSYVGSVRTMVVAAYEGAYGKADKATPVRKPLMVLTTLPRVLGPEETLRLPVTLFTMDKSIRSVNVTVKVAGPVSLTETTRTVTMDRETMTTDFGLRVKSETGMAHIEVMAVSGSFKASEKIDIEIRNPNPPVTRVTEVLLEAGKSWNGVVSKVGVPGTNVATLEVSNLPPINLGQRLRYLMQYPYGCIEQTTSSVFPQLYLDQVRALTAEEKATVQTNIRAGIERLKLFVTRDGGFAYWPGGEDSDSWGSTYAGQFLVEAEAKGYFIPNDMIRRWKKYQSGKAAEWRKSSENQSSELIQAYRLYSLALAGSADLASMNRLREMGALPAASVWMLASAYVKAGQPEAARTLVANAPTSIKPYQEMAYSYGSDIRDEAIILETLILLNDRGRAFDLVKLISAELSNPNAWLSTQSTAWCLKSVGMYAGGEKKGPLKFTYTTQGKQVVASTDLNIAQVSLPAEATDGNLALANQSGGPLFARIITEGVPARGEEEEVSNNLKVVIQYNTLKGQVVDPTRLEQGTSFVATVTIANTGMRGAYKNLALRHIVPSGWEISNLRLTGDEAALAKEAATYQDIRDDRVYTYFDLAANQTKSFRVLLTATYAGSYYLPAVSCEAMYDRTVFARTRGQVVEVTKSNP